MRRALTALAAVTLAACVGQGAGVSTTSRTGATEVPSTGPASTSPAPSTTLAASTTTALPTTTIGIDETVLAYEQVSDALFPVQMTARPGDPTAYLITKEGRVWAFDGEAVGDQPVLDISGQVAGSGERGLLSIALHPTDPGRFYLHYSDLSGDTVVSEFTLTSPTSADPGSERILFQVDQPAPNHNGGMLEFTPDGQLLLGLGDGGGSGDRYRNGQNPDTFLAGLVSMRVDGDPDPTKYAMGLRNPWRFWIDEGNLYVADVGQDVYEEVSVVPLEPGHNFGWPIFEGLHCYGATECDGDGMVVPVIEVAHGDAGSCSITGGIVYRAAALPQLAGHYFYSDYCGGYLRSFLYADGVATDQRDWTEQVGVPGQVTGFGIDGQGEMYLTAIGGVYKVVPGG